MTLSTRNSTCQRHHVTSIVDMNGLAGQHGRRTPKASTTRSPHGADGITACIGLQGRNGQHRVPHRNGLRPILSLSTNGAPRCPHLGRLWPPQPVAGRLGPPLCWTRRVLACHHHGAWHGKGAQVPHHGAGIRGGRPLPDPTRGRPGFLGDVSPRDHARGPSTWSAPLFPGLLLAQYYCPCWFLRLLY